MGTIQKGTDMTQRTLNGSPAIDILRGVSIIMHMERDVTFGSALRRARRCEGKQAGDGARALDLLQKAREELCANGSTDFAITSREGVVKALRHLVPPQPLRILKNDDPLRL